MDRELDALGMLDLMVRPGFCVKEQKITACNPAAQALLFAPGMEISGLLGTAAQDYAAFSGGCLYLTVHHSGARWGASVNRIGGCDIFILEEDEDHSELQAMALAARELRDPLSSVMTTADRLFPMAALEEDPRLRDQVARLNRGLYQMLRVIGNMSDASRFASATAAQPEMLDVCGVFREIFDKAQPLVAHTGLRLHADIPAQCIYTLADREKLERAVLNIISNAIKFTPAGGTIRATLTRRENRLYLSVTDSGEGIPDSLRGGLHSRYLRQPGIEDGRFGIGLGMVLIRSAAAIHGGTVLIDHPEGAGTRITMTLAIRADSSGTIRTPLLRMDYAGERDHALIELSDTLPAELYEAKKIH